MQEFEDLLSQAVQEGLPDTTDSAMLDDIAGRPGLIHEVNAIDAVSALLETGQLHQTDLESVLTRAKSNELPWPVDTPLGHVAVRQSLAYTYRQRSKK